MSFRNGGQLVTNGLIFALDSAASKSLVSGATLWNDLTYGSSGAILINSPAYTATNGGTLTLNGSSQYMPASGFTALDGAAIMSIEAVVRSNSAGQTNTILSKWGSADVGHYSWLLFPNWFGTNTGFFLVGNSAGTSFSQHPFPLTWDTGLYYQIDVTYSGGRVSAYVNGVSLYTGMSSNTTLKSVPTPMTVGSDWDVATADGLKRPWNGSYGAIRVYNRELSAGEVAQNWNATRGRYGL